MPRKEKDKQTTKEAEKHHKTETPFGRHRSQLPRNKKEKTPLSEITIACTARMGAKYGSQLRRYRRVSPRTRARALSLAILLPPVSIGAVLEYHQHDGIDWTAAGVILIAYMATNFPGAALGRRHNTQRFLRVTGAALLILGSLSAGLVWTGSP